MTTEDITALPTDRQPTLRVRTQPNDANPDGDIFGGWLMSQIDIAGAIVAAVRAQGRVATVAVKDLHFIKPLYVHDLVSFYAEVISTGKTSVTVAIDVYAQRLEHHPLYALKISTATLVYVALAKPGEKRIVPE